MLVFYTYLVPKLYWMKHISIFVAVFCFCFVASAQNFSLSGTVVDQDQNIPLLGATVLVKGTQNGVTTDFDGNFKIDEVSINDILVVSYVGQLCLLCVILNPKTWIKLMFAFLRPLSYDSHVLFNETQGCKYMKTVSNVFIMFN